MSSYPLNPLPGVPTKVTISPASATLAFAETQQLTATLLDPYGNTVEPSSAFSFKSANLALLSVDSSGLCTAVNPDPTVMTPGGVVRVTVTYQFVTNTLSAECAITITGTPVETRYASVYRGAVDKYFVSPDARTHPGSLLVTMPTARFTVIKAPTAVLPQPYTPPNPTIPHVD